LVKTTDAAATSDSELIELMTGRKIDVLFPTITHRPSGVAIDIENLSVRGNRANGVSFQARSGEITGIAGLVGCGKSELVRAIYGLEPIRNGTIRLNGVPYECPSPHISIQKGVAYFPADRVAEGLALSRPIRENASMAALELESFSRLGVLNLAGESARIQQIMNQLKLRPPRIESAVGGLSGGNRQKVMLGRALTREFSIFLFDEPTVGIDVGAKLEVYNFIVGLVENGAAVVVVSSELPEVLALSNRLYVMHHGRIVAELQDDQKTEQNVLASFFKDSSMPTDTVQ